MLQRINLGLFTRLAINRLKLLHDSGTGRAPDLGVRRGSDDFELSAAPVRQQSGVCVSSAERAVAERQDIALMELLELEIAREIHPVDVIEQVAHTNDWSFERTGDDEISISVTGTWTDYQVSFSWIEDFEALQLACPVDIKGPEN